MAAETVAETTETKITATVSEILRQGSSQGLSQPSSSDVRYTLRHAETTLRQR